jgi:hypothetical protein
MTEEFFITRLTAVFFSYLVAALLVERFVEIMVAVLKYLELKFMRPNFWTGAAENMRRRFERLYYLHSLDKKATLSLDMLLWNLVTVSGEAGRRTLVADLVRLHFYRLIAYVFTFGTALALAFAIKYNFISIIVAAFPEIINLFDPRKYEFLNILLTALALSFGSQPLHQLICRLEKRLESKTELGGAK